MADSFLNSLGDLAKIGQAVFEESDEKEWACLPIDQIYSKAQPRVEFEKIEELAESLKAVGQQQAIVVVEDGKGQYVIEQGERRWRAAKIAGIDKLYCIINHEKLDDHERVIRQLTENIQRDNMKLHELSKAISKLIKEGLTIRDLAKQLGKRESWISTLNTIAELPKELDKAAKEQLIKDPQGMRKMLSLYDRYPQEVKRQLLKWQKKAKVAQQESGNADEFTVSRAQIMEFAKKLANGPIESEHLGTSKPVVDDAASVEASPISDQEARIDAVSEAEFQPVETPKTKMEEPSTEGLKHIDPARVVIHVLWKDKPAVLACDVLPPTGKLCIELMPEGRQRLVEAKEVQIVSMQYGE